MWHFSEWNVAKSDATLLHVFKIKTLLQRSSASTQGFSLNAILVQSTTASIHYEEITQYFQKMPPFYAMCPILFRKNTVCIQVRPSQSTAASIEALYCRAILHVLKEIPHHYPKSVTFLSIRKTLWQKQKFRRDGSLQRYTVAQNKLFQSSLSGFKIHQLFSGSWILNLESQVGWQQVAKTCSLDLHKMP